MDVSPVISDKGYLVFAGAFKGHESFSANEAKAGAFLCALMKANELEFSNIQTFFSAAALKHVKAVSVDEVWPLKPIIQNIHDF